MYTNELTHYGVLGMKWGKRRYQNADGSLTPAGKVRAAAKNESSARKTMNKTGVRAFGLKGIDRYQKAEKEYNKAQVKTAQARVDLAKSKGKDNADSEKREFKAYTKELRRSGLPGSVTDSSNKGRSTALAKDIAKRKGQDYADRVLKKAEKTLVRDFAVSAAVTTGATAVSIILANK